VSATLFVCLFAAQSAFLVLGPILPDVAYEFDIGSAAAGLNASCLSARGQGLTQVEPWSPSLPS
jgi:predicted MFS family arabinose efflux permease